MMKDAVVQLYSRYAPEEDTKENEIHLTRSEETVLTVQKRNDVQEKTVDKLRKQLIKESEARRQKYRRFWGKLELVNPSSNARRKKRREREKTKTGRTSTTIFELKRYLHTLFDE